MLGRATDYAANNAQLLIEAAMMDDRRQLTEQTLPGIQRGAMASGNTNSSMSAVNQAIANRGFKDRRSRTATDIMDRLTDRSLSAQQNQLANMAAANQNLAGLYGMGFDLGGAGASAMTGAGSAYQADEQARLDDERMRFEGERDYGLNLAGAFGNILKSTYPGGASFGSVQANTADPFMAALSGGMSGFGFGGNLFGGGGPVMANTGTGYFSSGGGLFGRQLATPRSIRHRPCRILATNVARNTFRPNAAISVLLTPSATLKQATCLLTRPAMPAAGRGDRSLPVPRAFPA